MTARRGTARVASALLATAVLTLTAAGPGAPATAAAPHRAPAADAVAVGSTAAPARAQVASAGLVGDSDVDSTGALTTHVAFDVPADRGLQPSLALTYDSSAGNGWTGVGWELTGPSYVSRVSATRGVPAMTATDLFRLDGQDLLPCPAPNPSPAVAPSCRLANPVGAAHYTTAGERDWVIVRHVDPASAADETWTVTGRDGTVRTYVVDRMSIGSIGHPSAPIRLHLAEVRDRLGHTAVYRYAGDTNAVPVPTSVTYDGYVVRLIAQPRPDPVRSGDGSRVAVLGSRLAAVAVYDSDTLVRAYRLHYTTSDATGRSVLADVATYGSAATVHDDGSVSGDPVQTQRLRLGTHTVRSPWTAGTSDAQGASDVPPDNAASARAVGTGLPYTWTGSGRLGDFDGQGRSEQMLLDSGNAGCHAFLRWVHPQAGTSQAITLHFAFAGSATWCTTDDWWAADVDGDGRADLVFQQHGSTQRDVLVVFRNNGNATFTQTAVTGAVIPTALVSEGECRPGDVTGSGREAVVCLYTPNNHHVDRPAHLITAVANATATSFAVSDVDPHFELGDPAADQASFSGTDFALGDVNGDGRADLFHPLCPPNPGAGCRPGSPGFQTLLSTASDATATFGPATDHVAPSALSTWSQPIGQLTPADLNGDGLTDYVAITYPLTNAGIVCRAHATVASAIAHSDGTFTFVTDAVPHQFMQETYGGLGANCAAPMIEFGSVGPDGSTGILMVLLRGGHRSPSPCAPAIAPLHPEVLRSASRGDGTFDWPSSWDDCAHVQELPVDWSAPSFLEGLFANLVGFFFDMVVNAPVVSVGQAPLIRPDQAIGVSSVAGDVDGDGVTDVELFTKRVFTDVPTLEIAYTPPGDQHDDWVPAHQTDDGDTGMLRVVSRGSSVQVTTITHRQVLPAQCGGQPGTGACSPYVSAARTLDPAPDPGAADRVLHSEAHRDWHVLDGLGDGREAVVYVESGHRLDQAGTTGTVIATYPWGPGGLVQVPVVTRLAESPGVQHGPWLAAVGAAGRTQLLSVVRAAGLPFVAQLTERRDNTWAVTLHPLVGAGSSVGPDAFWRVGDVDGDHRPDLVHIAPGMNSATVTTILTGDSAVWTAARTSVTMRGSDADAAHWLLGDVDGDGLADVVHVNTDTAPAHVLVASALAAGNGTWAARPAVDDTDLADSPGSGAGTWSLQDTNADGTDDLVHLRPAPKRVGTDDVDVAPAIPGDAQFSRSGWFSVPDAGRTRRGLLPLDLDGDGDPDLVSVTRTGGSYTLGTLVADARIDRLESATNGIGGTQSYEYRPASTWRAAYSPFTCLLPAGVGWLALSAVHTDAGSSAGTNTLGYGCPHWSTSHLQVLGWSSQTTTEPATAAGDGSVTTEQRTLSDACGTQTTAVTVASSIGTTLSTQRVGLDHPALSPSQACRPATRTTTECRATCGTSTDAYTYDEYGNVARDEQSETSVAGTHHRRADTAYAYDAAGNLVDLPRQLTVVDEDPSPTRTLRQTRYCYDQACGVTAVPGAGELTSQTAVDVDGGSADRTATFAYDADGNEISTVDAMQRVTTTAYDPVHHLFPVSTVDPLGKVTATRWDYGLGRALAVTDANDLTTRFGYDQYGRLTRTTVPGAAPVDVSYEGFGTPDQQVRTATQDGSASGLWQVQRFDGLGRVVLQARKADDADDAADVTRSTYADTRNPVAVQTSWLRTAWPVPDIPAVAPAEQYHYDELGRITRQTHADRSAVTYTYGADPRAPPDTTTVTSETGRQSQTSGDPWGRQVSLTQGTGITQLRRTTTYDAADDAQTSTDPAGDVTRWTYDSFGEVATQADADRGETRSEHDADGEVVSTTDATVTVTFGYDYAGRLVRRHVDGLTDATWSYDEPGHGASAGRLTGVSGPGTAGCPGGRGLDIDYDTDGRALNQTRCVDGRTETVGTGYDAYGRAATIDYPDGLVTAVTYDAAGRVSGVGDAVSAVSYDPSDRPTRITLGDGSTQALGYDADRGWLSGSTTSAADGSRVDAYSSTRNADATVSTTTTVDATPAAADTTARFDYDDIGRLTGSGGTYPQTTSYDAAGNVLVDSDVGTAHYPVAPCSYPDCRQAHSPTSITAPGATYARTSGYDAHGNAIAVAGPFGTDRLGWTPLDQLASVAHVPAGASTAADTTTLTYDGTGAVVEENSTASGSPHELQNFGGLVSWDSGAGLVDKVRLGGQVVATRDDDGWHYLHYDERGSLSSVTDAAGAVAARVAYLPWGAVQQQVGTLPAAAPGFSGSAPVLDTRYDLLGDRVLDPSQQRMLSPDDLADSGGVLGLNRYAYAGDDPVDARDPSGQQGEWDDGDGGDSGSGDDDGLSVTADGALDQWSDWSTSFPAGAGSADAGIRDIPGFGVVDWDRNSDWVSGEGPTDEHFENVVLTATQPAAAAPAAVPAVDPSTGTDLNGDGMLGLDTVVLLMTVQPGQSAEVTQARQARAQRALYATIPALEQAQTILTQLLADTVLAPFYITPSLVAGGRSRVNPLGGTNNCVNCVIAGDATLAGQPATALDTTGPQPIAVLEQRYGSSFKPVSGQAEIEQIMSNAGAGARGIVFGNRGAKPGHVFNVVNQGGAVRFVDFQSGRGAGFGGYQGFSLLRTN